MLVEKLGSKFPWMPNSQGSSFESHNERYSCKTWKLEENPKQLFTSGSCEQAHGCCQQPTWSFTRSSLLSSENNTHFQCVRQQNSLRTVHLHLVHICIFSDSPWHSLFQVFQWLCLSLITCTQSLQQKSCTWRGGYASDWICFVNNMKGKGVGTSMLGNFTFWRIIFKSFS